MEYKMSPWKTIRSI